MGYITQYVPEEDECDIAGWGLFLNRTCGDSGTRSYIGCKTPEDAIALFLGEPECFSKNDVSIVVPIFDYRLTSEEVRQ